MHQRFPTIAICSALLLFGCDKDDTAAKDDKAADKGADSAGKGGGSPGKAGGPAPAEAAPGKKIASIDVASLSTCALMEDGTVRCWGGNLEGQLGVDKEADAFLETYTPLQVAGVTGAKKMWAGASYSWSGSHSEGTTDTVCVQMADGAVSCWGHNGLVFGDGEYKNQPKATPIGALAKITDLDSESGHACGVWPDKTAKCWGSNAFGVLGIGNDEREAKEPTPVKDFTGAAEVGCGQNHCCGRKEDGTVSCWGYGSSGQLGNGTNDKVNAPVAVTGLSDATQLAVATNTNCALDKDGTVVCWGSDFDREPKLVEGATDITAIDGEGFVCGLKKDETVVCWGPNNWGQLGDGTKEDRRKTAAPVKGLSGVKEVKVGDTHACALLADNTMKCWGKNGRGQLGDGTNTDRLEPVAVVQVGSETLTPMAPADMPSALPADEKVQELVGVPDGCPSKVELEAKVAGKSIPFLARHVEATWNWGKLGYSVSFLNYDIDEKNKWAMPRGAQARIGFGLEKWVIEKNAEGKELPVQKPADAEGAYTTSFTGSYRVTNSAGIFDNHKQRFFNAGDIKITHLDDKWVCGEINLSHDKDNHSLTGKFAAAIPAKPE
jgi:alpha-tubulin suppressor-like RCC1 family protein